VNTKNKNKLKNPLYKTYISCKAGINHLLWPSACLICKKITNEDSNELCDNCNQQILQATAGQYCHRCGRDTSQFAILDGKCPMCTNENFYFDKIIRCGIYDKAIKKMVLSMKNGKSELADFAALMATALLYSASEYKQIDLFVPVPLHWTRRLSRGYNQSLLVAKKIKQAKAKINTELVRTKKTSYQASMDTPNQRLKNVKDAFAVRKNHKLQDKTICLVDDIKTTGATLNECARTLKLAGAKKVYALVLTVAGQKTK